VLAGSALRDLAGLLDLIAAHVTTT
jgi:hypothetical protein